MEVKHKKEIILSLPDFYSFLSCLCLFFFSSFPCFSSFLSLPCSFLPSVIPAFFFSSLSFPGLTGESKDPRNALRLPEDDGRKNIVIPVFLSSLCYSRVLFFSLSFPGLTGKSKDPRNALRLSEDDRRKNIVIPVLFFSSVIAGLDPAIQERDVRLKPEHDREKSTPFRDAFLTQFCFDLFVTVTVGNTALYQI